MTRKIITYTILYQCLCNITLIPGIVPNIETKVLLVQIFGEKSHPMRKYQRIMYWFPKFKNINPFPVPKQLPEDPVDLARFSLTRIANDLNAKVSIYQVQLQALCCTWMFVCQVYAAGDCKLLA